MADENLRLRAALRDLVALSAIPAGWIGIEPHTIAARLADILAGSLGFDFAFVRLRDPTGGATVDVTGGCATREFSDWLQAQLSAPHESLRKQTVPHVIGFDDRRKSLRSIVIPIGFDAHAGLVAVGCERSDFPTETDKMLISVAANHAATAFRGAILTREWRRTEEELRKARDELEMKVMERTAELQRTMAELADLYRNLAEREAKVRRLFEANIIGIFFWDLDGRILEANDTFLRMVGYDRDDLVSGRLHWRDLTPPEWRGADARAVEQVRIAGSSQTYEKEYFRKDGGRLPILIGGATFAEGGNQGVAFVLDLTGQKQAEAEARESEQRYREMQMEVAHANRVATMGLLTASIAHEVNQPIAAAVTNAEVSLRLLDAQPPDLDEVRQALDQIAKDARRAGDVVGRIHGLVKKAPARKDWVDMNEAIGEVIELTRGDAIKNGASVYTEFGDGLPLVLGDRVQLQQVMLNLIVNSVQAMCTVAEGPRDLFVTTARAEPDGVLVAVKDSGPGLAPGNLEHVFTAFYTTKPDGLGMGLSICRSIVESHGGRLSVSANLPRGAIFQFTVPTHPDGAS